MSITLRLDKDAILETLDIRRFWDAELQGRIVRRSGSNWLARSPFREDREPSFSINVENGLWNDFAGEGGDVFKFVMLRYGLTFSDALAYAERCLGGCQSFGLDSKTSLNISIPKRTPREYSPSDFRYFELVEGPPSNRKAGQMMQGPSGLLFDLFGQPPIESYTSAFLFSDEAVEYRNNPTAGAGVGSLAGYKGPIKAPVLFFDFDCAGDPGKALWDVVALLDRLDDLESYSPESIRIYFSGSKGFHVLLLDPGIEAFPGSENADKIIGVFCRKLATDLTTFDEKIYTRIDKQDSEKIRLIRAINSRHPKTGLFKIPLTLEEVDDLNFSMEDIRNLARKQRKINTTVSCEGPQLRKAA